MATKNTTKSTPLNSSLFNTSVSCVTVSLCCLNFFQFDGLLSAGKIHSPTILIIAASELIRWATNKFVFALDASSKDFVISGARNASATSKSTSVASNIKNTCKLFVLLTTFTLVYALVCILMGASYHNRYEETLVLSAILTALTVFPVGLFLGASKTLQYLFYDTFELNCRLDVAHLESLQYNALGALIGAWAGSVVAPLDWDRDWQTYPIPNVMGALIGFAGANIHNLLWSVIYMSNESVSDQKKTT